MSFWQGRLIPEVRSRPGSMQVVHGKSDQAGPTRTNPTVFFDVMTVRGLQPESQEVSSSHPPRPPDLIRIVGIPAAISETPLSGIVRSRCDVTHQTLRFCSWRRNLAHHRGAWGVCVVRRGAGAARTRTNLSRPLHIRSGGVPLHHDQRAVVGQQGLAVKRLNRFADNPHQMLRPAAVMPTD